MKQVRVCGSGLRLVLMKRNQRLDMGHMCQGQGPVHCLLRGMELMMMNLVSRKSSTFTLPHQCDGADVCTCVVKAVCYYSANTFRAAGALRDNISQPSFWSLECTRPERADDLSKFTQLRGRGGVGPETRCPMP